MSGGPHSTSSGASGASAASATNDDAYAGDRALLRRFEPVLQLHNDELFLPAAVDDYVVACSLRMHTDRGVETLVPVGGLTIDNLADAEGGRQNVFLQFVDEHERRSHRRIRIRKHNHGAARLSRVGFFGRIFDVLFRLSLVLRQTVPAGVTAAAAVKAKDLGMHRRPVYYGRVVRDGGWTVLHYQFFYAMNDWRSTFSGVNDHEADWEQIMVFVEEVDGEASPHWVAYSNHDHSGDDLRRAWDDPELIRVGEHPVAWVGGGSHAHYFRPGQYTTRVKSSAFDRVRRWTNRGRRLLRIETLPEGLGIPYVDHADGRGNSIGPMQSMEWECRLLDPWPEWAADFRGLWGLDTADRTGGERAPSGPRFERDGSIRRSWMDPLGYAGLHKVAPPSQADAIRTRRLDALEIEASALHARLESARLRLRAGELVGGLAPAASTALEEELERYREQDAGLRAERRRLQVGRRPATDLRAHLQHVPIPDRPTWSLRSRLLNTWVTISVPMLFMLAGLVIPLHRYIGFWALIIVVAMVAVEAVLRQQVISFVKVLVAIAVVVGVIGIAVYFAVRDWRWTLMAVLAGTGVLVLAANLKERFTSQ